MNDDDQRGRRPARLGRMEILSAWLGFWTPRDAEVPPVPWRWVAVLGAGLVLVAVAVAVVAVPAIREGKEEGEARDRRAAEAEAAERLAQLRAQQTPHRGRGRAARDGAGRAALLERVRASIEADARRRLARGELDGPAVRRVDCRPSPRPGTGARRSFGCTAVTSDIPAGPRNVPGSLGHPFVVVVDFSTGRYTWCKTNPPPGEQVVPNPRDVVALPDDCLL